MLLRRPHAPLGVPARFGLLARSDHLDSRPAPKLAESARTSDFRASCCLLFLRPLLVIEQPCRKLPPAARFSRPLRSGIATCAASHGALWPSRHRNRPARCLSLI